MIVVFSGFAAYAVIRMSREGLIKKWWCEMSRHPSERISWHIRRIDGVDEPIEHSCLTWVKMKKDLNRHSTPCGRQQTGKFLPYDLELRNCTNCGSSFVARKIPKPSTPHEATTT